MYYVASMQPTQPWYRDWTVTRVWRDVQADGPGEAMRVTLRADADAVHATRRTALPFDGFSEHPDLTPLIAGHLLTLVAELGVCVRDHPEDERLARVEANVRWLLGERV